MHTICEPVELVLAEVLCEPGKSTRQVYFPTTGFISLLTLIDAKPALEVGMVGREGMLGAHMVLCADEATEFACREQLS